MEFQPSSSRIITDVRSLRVELSTPCYMAVAIFGGKLMSSGKLMCCGKLMSGGKLMCGGKLMFGGNGQPYYWP